MPDVTGRGQQQPGGPEFKTRLQEIAAGEYAPEVYVHNGVTAAVLKGKQYTSGTGPLSLTAAGNIRATISNPTGSGVNVSIFRLVWFSNAMGEASLFLNPSAGLPATAVRPRLNAIAGTAGGLGEVKADTSATTALAAGTGTDTGVIIGLGANVREVVDLPPIVLTPGVTLGINVPISATTSRSVLSVLWFEE